MTNIKTLVGTAAAAALAISATSVQAAPGARDNDRLSAGEVIAGAVVLGTVAAVLASSSKDKYDYRDDRYDRYPVSNNRHYGYGNGYGYNRYGNNYRYGYINLSPREAVDRCVRAAQNRASRWGQARVVDIRDVDDTRYGYKVKGKITVRTHGYRGPYYDDGRFTCYTDGRGAPQIEYSGLGNYRW
jgi:hypothetical protein